MRQLQRQAHHQTDPGKSQQPWQAIIEGQAITAESPQASALPQTS
jgi:hypothetical protein